MLNTTIQSLDALSTDMPAIESRVLVGIDAMASIEAQWRALERTCSERFTYFQSYDWCKNWADIFCGDVSPVGKPVIVTLWQGEELVFLWPAMISNRKFGASVLCTLGEPHTQYASAITAAVFDPVMHKSLLENALRSIPNVDLVSFEAVPQDSMLLRALGNDAVDANTENETAYFDFTAFADWEGVLASMSKSQRRSRRKRLKQFEALGEVSFDIIPGDDPAYQDIISTAFTWKKRWLRETGRVSRGFSMEGYDTFIQSLAATSCKGDGAFAACLRIDGKPVAIEQGFVHHGHYYAYIGAFDYDFYDYSPGKVALQMMLQRLMERGVQSYDLLGNPAEYKSSWSTNTTPLHQFFIPLSLLGRLYMDLWIDKVRPGLKKVYHSTPASLRRSALSQMAGLANPKKTA